MDDARAAGTLVGLACGDALGRPVEFQSPEAIRSRHGRVTELLGDGTHGQPPGTITDDTEMALCIARSLVEEGRFDPKDVSARFVTWYESGPFDIGILTSTVLGHLRHHGRWHESGVEEWTELPEGSNAGNGSVMRCAPYGVAFADAPESLVVASRASSVITHADPRCQWGCVVLNATIAGLIRGEDAPLAGALETATDAPAELREAVEAVAAVIDGARDDDLVLANSGYVVTTLQAGLYHGLTAATAEDAIVDAVMMGGDTDTLAAVAGAVAGARFGIDALPARWVSEIAESDELRRLGEQLLDADVGVDADVVDRVERGEFDL